MKAFVFEKYGDPLEVLELKDIPKPIPKDNEVLIKVHSAAVNDFDWSHITGLPKLYRMMFGLNKPKHQISGMELSGEVEAIGEKVVNFKIGDTVFGDLSEYGFGAFAEYISVNEKAVIKKPSKISFEEAAAIPHASTLAYQGLVEIGEIENGQKVLINGGGGGVGSIGLQIAKQYDCHITGIDSAEKAESMKSLGYDKVLDYRNIDFTNSSEKYDLILDCKSNKPTLSYFKALKANGKYVTIGGNPGNIFSILFIGKLSSPFTKKKLHLLALKPNKNLATIADLFAQKKLKCLIDGPHPFEDLPKHVKLFGDGKHKGKVIINFNSAE